MKLHLPLSLRSALLACLALFPAAYASTYVATGVDKDNLTASDRFYDNGLGVYWTAAGEQPFAGVETLYGQTGSTEFLGSLNAYIPEGEFSSASFSGLSNDDKTSWLSTTANVVQYWQSHYGVFSQKTGDMPYGYTYAPENQVALGGTQSLNTGMYFYDNWTNDGGDFAMAARWYLTNDHRFTNLAEQGLSVLKNQNAAAGYFTPYFADHDASVVVTDPSSQEALDAAVIKAFGLTATGNENEYKQAKPGQIAYLGISSGENSDSLTCYGFETDSNGNVKALLLASATDAEYTLSTLYVKEDAPGERVRLYTDADCTQLWQHGNETNWYLSALSYIETPEVLVDMYNEYNASTLTWTGATSTWKQEADNKSLYILPDASSGWTAHASTGTEFAGEYAAYYTEGRNVLFTSTGAGTIELIGNIEPSSVTVNNARGADYTITGEGKLTGITRLTKQGEGSLTISTTNDYSGGTRLEGGKLVVGNASAFGSSELELVKGILDLNGNTIANSLYVSEGAEVTLRNGTITGDMLLLDALSFTADDFQVQADNISIQGNGTTSCASFVNLNNTAASDGTGYLRAETVSISDMAGVKFTQASVSREYDDLQGGVINSMSIDLQGNADVCFGGNTITSYSDVYGGVLGSLFVQQTQNGYSSQSGPIQLSENANVSFSGNTVSSWNVYGGLAYGHRIEWKENGCIDLSGNTINASGDVVAGVLGFAYYGGYPCDYGSIILNDNDTLRVNDNAVTSGYGMWGGIMAAENTAIQGNLRVEFSENRLQSEYDLMGGVLYAAAGGEISGNTELDICNNRAESIYGMVRGGGVLLDSAEHSLNINQNGDVTITGNAVISASDALGAAIYAQGDVQLANNNSVYLRGNYEQNGGDYRLRSIYACGNLELSADTDQKVHVYDSVYTSGNLVLNAEDAAGEIVLSGEHTATDLEAIRKAPATLHEIVNSRTSTAVGITILQGGTLSLVQEAILQTRGVSTSSGSGAELYLDKGMLKSFGGAATVASGTGIHAAGINGLLMAEYLQMQEDSYMSFTLSAENKEYAALTMFDSWQIEGNMTVNVNVAGNAQEDYYILMDVGAYGSMPENWSADTISVNGADYNQLVWQDGYLYLNCSGGEIARIQSYLWQGTQNNIWDASTANWQQGNAVAYKDNVMVEFHGAGAGDVELTENFAARGVLVDSAEDYHFVGVGRLEGLTRLMKRGEGTLTISTANAHHGGTCLEGGTLVADHAEAFGFSHLELVKGMLELNANTIKNDIYVSEAADVTVRNGSSMGGFVLSDASSFTADNFRLMGDSVSLVGDGETSQASFVNLLVTDESENEYRGGYMQTSSVAITDMADVYMGKAKVEKRHSPLLGGLVHAGASFRMSGNGNVSMADNAVSSAIALEGGLVWANDIDMHDNEGMIWTNNAITSFYTIDGGLIYGSSQVSMSENPDIQLSGNTIDADSSVGGGLIYGGLVSLTDNGTIDMSGNAISAYDAIFGGLIYSALSGEHLSDTSNGAILLNCNGTLRVNANEAMSEAYQVTALLSTPYLQIQGNTLVEMEGNEVNASGDIYGGVLEADKEVLLTENEKISILNNTIESTNGVAYGAAMYQGSNHHLFTCCTSLTGNGEVEIMGNAAISTTEALGGAIYSAGDVQILNNDSVVLRKNYEHQGNDYCLRSIYTGGNLELSAAIGRSVQVFDSVYAVGDMLLNENGTGGEILLSGEHTVADLESIKQGSASLQEIYHSRTNIVEGVTHLDGGTLSLVHGAVLQTNGFDASSGSVYFNQGTIDSSVYAVTFAEGSGLNVEGAGNHIKAADFQMQDNSFVSFTLDSEEKERPVLILSAPWQIEGNIELNITCTGTQQEDYYILMDIGAYSSVPERWADSSVSVKGADYSQLVWRNGYLYFNAGGVEIPQISACIWQGSENNVWDNETTNWLQGNTAALYTDYATVEFLGAGAGEIELTGALAARSVLVNSAADYSFTGDGQLTGTMSLIKRGEGALIVSTANTYNGGTYLEGGTLTAGCAEAFGYAGLQLVKGTLDLNGYTLANTLHFAEGAEVVVKNGTSVGDLALTNAASFTSDYFRVVADSVTMEGNEVNSRALFTNPGSMNSDFDEYAGGFIKADTISISGMAELSMSNARVDRMMGNVAGALVHAADISLMNNTLVQLSGNMVIAAYDVSGGLIDGGVNLNAYTIKMVNNKTIQLNGNTITVSNPFDEHLFMSGGLLRGSISIECSEHVELTGNNISSSTDVNGGLIDCSSGCMEDIGELDISRNTVCSEGDVTGGLLRISGFELVGSGTIRLNNNEISSQGSIEGGLINSPWLTIQDNEEVEILCNTVRASSPDYAYVYGGALYGRSGLDSQIADNGSIKICDNVAESQAGPVHGGAVYLQRIFLFDDGRMQWIGNGELVIQNNAAISGEEALGGAVYSGGHTAFVNNRSVMFRGNYEKQGADYRLRGIYAGENLEFTANEGQHVEVYDSVYVGGNLALNANGAAGNILLSGEHTEADLLAIKGSAGTVSEITNSRTNTVVGKTTLGGGTLSLEHGAILQTGGFAATAGSGAVVYLDNAVLNSSGYDVCFGSGTALSVGGSNTLTAANFTMESGSVLNVDLRDKNRNLSALALNGNMSLSGLDFSVQNADVMAAGKYKLISLGSDAHYDVGSWAASLNSVTGVDAADLVWENGTLYYVCENTWVISATQDAEIIEAPASGSDVVIGGGAAVQLGVCLQNHLGCTNPKHGGRPGNPGQGHAHLKPGNNGNNGNGNNGNNGNGNGNNKDHGHGDVVLVEGSAYIKNNGSFEGLLNFRGSAEEERHFYTEKDLGIAYITVFTDADATSHMHIAEDKTVTTEGIVGDGNLSVQGGGTLVLNGHDSENEAEATSSLYYGSLGVQEGAVRVENNSQAYVANTEVNGADHAAAMQVGKGAAMTGESLSVSGENATLHNDGSIAMTEGISVDGGTVKGSGTFSGLSMNGGSLVIGNSPGLQAYQGALELKATDVVFSVAGYEQAADATTSGWNVGVYSTIDMGGNSLTLTGETTLTIAFGADALGTLVSSTTVEPLSFSLTLFQNVGNVGFFDESMLALMLEQTRFIVTSEVEGLPAWAAEFKGADVSEYVVSDSSYYTVSNTNVVFVGSIAVNGNLIPEPATATLSLLALTLLAARRRRKYASAA